MKKIMHETKKTKNAQMSMTAKLVILALFIVFALIVIVNLMRKIMGGGP
jgi:hypothetical protein